MRVDPAQRTVIAEHRRLRADNRRHRGKRLRKRAFASRQVARHRRRRHPRRRGAAAEPKPAGGRGIRVPEVNARHRHAPSGRHDGVGLRDEADNGRCTSKQHV